VEKASKAGLSDVLTKSNLLDISYLSLRTGGAAIGLVAPSSALFLIRRELMLVVDSPRAFLILSMPHLPGIKKLMQIVC